MFYDSVNLWTTVFSASCGDSTLAIYVSLCHFCSIQTVWDSPMDLFQFFKRPPNEDAERMARASDIFETTVNYVNEKVLQKYRRSLS